MKKTWVALAVLGAFATVAQAQSSVTLYGIADVNVQMLDPDNADSTVGVNSGHQSGSRWGFRGSEDLGGGLKAVFTLENGYNVDTGGFGDSTRLFNRQAWVGLEAGFGTVALGRFASLGSGTGSFDMFGSIDPFLTGFGGLNLVFTQANAFRYDNGILFKSAKFGGLQFGLEHSRRVSGPESPLDAQDFQMTGGAISFGTGPFFAAATYNVFKNPNGDDEKRLQAGATFDLGMVKLHGAYGKEDDRFMGGGGLPITNGADVDGFMGGVTVKLGAGSLMGSYQQYDADNGPELQRFGVAYAHPLSRRTNLYVSYGDNSYDNAAGTSFADFRVYTAGVRHLF